VSAEARSAADVQRIYANDEVEVRWEPRLCIHTGRCFRGLPEVFDPKARPWVRVDAASAERIMDVVASCPTGALNSRRLDVEPEDAAAAATIVPQPNGPLYVTGRVRVEDADGNPLREETRVALCRCGHSQNKPFCDGSHRARGFVAT